MTSIDHDNNDEEDNDHHEEEEEEDIVLPGYDAGVNESGVKHSQLKLKESAKRLSLKLLEIIDQNRNQNNDHKEEEGVHGENENENNSSRRRTTTTTTTTQTIDIQTFSCLNEEETLTYRCRCNFQIVQIPAIIPVTTASSSLSSSSSSFRYAMRSKGQPVLLGTKNSFPIATRRIQSAMKEFMDYINNSNNNESDNENENNNENNSNNTTITTRTSSIANKYLTSCTFSSAWNDLPDADCVLTLNYDQQYLDLDNNENESGKGNNKNKIAWKWKQEAQLLCQKLHLRQINGRSKGTLLSVRGGWGGGKEGEKNNNSSHGCNDDDNANDKNDEKEATIRDTVYLLRNDSCNNDNDNDKTSTMKVKWNVSLEGQQQQRPTGGSVTTEIDRSNDDNHNNNDDNDDANNKSTIITTTIFPVHYEKPETAFYHPNPNAMTKALAWMLDRLTCISISKQDANNDSKLKLLEMYCGCGAHTVALGRSGLISQILAIELDPRLVRSCEKNISLNGLQNLIKVYRGDAGRWSKEESRRRRRNRQRSRTFVETANSDSRMRNNNNDDDDNGSCNYDVLLVDPPRQGLDEEVCRMAMMTMSDDDDNNNDDSKVHRTSSGDDNNNNSSHGSGGCFQNILYVSCGHQALLRDLERLSPVYEVVNCAQMDLFPRTDSIETLVHLRKRTTTFT